MASQGRTCILFAVFILLFISFIIIEQKLDPVPDSLQKGNNWIRKELDSLNIKFHSGYLNQTIDISSHPVDYIESKSAIVVNSLTPLPNPPQKSRFAYVTLISGIDYSYKYRGFLYNALIMHRALEQKGSSADFIALIGYSEPDSKPFTPDINLLKSHGIIVHELPRLVDPSHKLLFAEMALLKITPYSFIHYEKIQFFDGDVMPTRNMDCFFHLHYNTFTIGAVSPLNSGWYLAIPNLEIYATLKEKAVWRLNKDWDETDGWGEVLPPELTVRGGRPVSKPVNKWNFNGADMDQGLFTHYFVLHHGQVILMDTDLGIVRYYKHGILKDHGYEEIPLERALECCQGTVPTRFFAHFTGRSKPWLEDARVNHDYKLWMKMLDGLALQEVNSTNIKAMKFGSPLGYWNPLKGGIKHSHGK